VAQRPGLLHGQPQQLRGEQCTGEQQPGPLHEQQQLPLHGQQEVCTSDPESATEVSSTAPGRSTKISPASSNADPVSISTETTTPVVTSVPSAPPAGPMTRRRHGIHQPKNRTDGTVAWMCVLAAHAALKHTHEPLDYK
jgi:hypothetical protein